MNSRNVDEDAAERERVRGVEGDAVDGAGDALGGAAALALGPTPAYEEHAEEQSHAHIEREEAKRTSHGLWNHPELLWVMKRVSRSAADTVSTRSSFSAP